MDKMTDDEIVEKMWTEFLRWPGPFSGMHAVLEFVRDHDREHDIRPCPYVRSSREGTSYCALSQDTGETVDTLRAELAEESARLDWLAANDAELSFDFGLEYPSRAQGWYLYRRKVDGPYHTARDAIDKARGKCSGRMA